MRTVDIAAVVTRAEHICAVRADTTAGRTDIESALRAVTQLQSWLSASNAALTRTLGSFEAFPDPTITNCTRGSGRDTARDTARAATLDAAPALAAALDQATITAGHVDEVTRAAKQLDGDQRQTLLDRVQGPLLDIAAVATVDDWRKRLAREVRNIRHDDGMDRLERQRRATRLRTWTDSDGMWCISARFDPVTALTLSARLDATVDAMFAETTPDTCPTDPIEKQHHLRALALAALADGTAPGARTGRPEFVVVVDTTHHDGAGQPTVDWGLPVEIPHRILTELAGDATVHPVIVRNGVVLHAPGQLDLGRTTRLANRAQRRALRALYPTCAIPGCTVPYRYCKIHHIIWWRHGGTTDLDNLLPVCTHHHTRIHTDRWQITIGPNRELTIRHPDSTVRTTGPPTRRAA
ncbi:MAG: hypothetical protein RLZZ01_1450 [Actinomycetota bacterium]